jgi:tRNA pseudouridine synthase 10
VRFARLLCRLPDADARAFLHEVVGEPVVAATRCRMCLGLLQPLGAAFDASVRPIHDVDMGITDADLLHVDDDAAARGGDGEDDDEEDEEGEGEAGDEGVAAGEADADAGADGASAFVSAPAVASVEEVVLTALRARVFDAPRVTVTVSLPLAVSLRTHLVRAHLCRKLGLRSRPFPLRDVKDAVRLRVVAALAAAAPSLPQPIVLDGYSLRAPVPPEVSVTAARVAEAQARAEGLPLGEQVEEEEAAAPAPPGGVLVQITFVHPAQDVQDVLLVDWLGVRERGRGGPPRFDATLRGRHKRPHEASPVPAATPALPPPAIVMRWLSRAPCGAVPWAWAGGRWSEVPTPPAPPGPASTACRFGVRVVRTPVFIAGRYMKLARNVAQSRWARVGVANPVTAEDEEVVEGCSGASADFNVTSAVTAPLRRWLGTAARCALASSGREDVDVRMLGDGRPFIVQVPDATRASLLARADVRAAIEREVALGSDEAVQVSGLRLSNAVEYSGLQKATESKSKTYVAVVWCSQPVSPATLAARLDAVRDVRVSQLTPLRVLHRRSALARDKVVHAMSTRWLNPHMFLLTLTTSAGTYVKEFVHGDLGRTTPCVADLLARGGPTGEGPAGGGVVALGVRWPSASSARGAAVEPGAGAGAGAGAAPPWETLLTADILQLDVLDMSV